MSESASDVPASHIKPRATMPEGATTLPARFYTSPRLFERELDLFFRSNWVLAGRAEEVPRKGDYVLRDLAGDSIIVTRSGEGDQSVRAFYNVCRHRGTRLCTAASGHFAGSIQCPYHSWTYDLSGQLIGAPHMDGTEGFDRAGIRLNTIAAEVWDGFIFVNLSEESDPLADHLGALPDKFAAWEMGRLRRGGRIVYEIAANWKLLIQNFNECLHCPNVHPALNTLSHYMSGENEPLRRTYMGGRMDLRPGIVTMSMDGSCPRDLLPGLSDAQKRGVYYYAIFPNLFLSLHPDYVMVHRTEPLAADRTRLTCEFLFAPEELAKPGFDIADVVEFWDMTNKQDWHVCELSQQGISSRGYQPGPYSNREDLLYAFDQFITVVLGEDRNQA
ncbi:MAG: aromatic ring-hydroxylating dioxygenase subunit alpha [Acidobacteria bacterium]|nr:aromatic ring-hydroxylating dioxygenase subunit alpha [Acidobacteriota bacterium]